MPKNDHRDIEDYDGQSMSRTRSLEVLSHGVNLTQTSLFSFPSHDCDGTGSVRRPVPSEAWCNRGTISDKKERLHRIPHTFESFGTTTGHLSGSIAFQQAPYYPVAHTEVELTWEAVL